MHASVQEACSGVCAGAKHSERVSRGPVLLVRQCP
jgi:hypothetical protein